jgi:F0F1-type ATP synthase epsilon subunit
MSSKSDTKHQKEELDDKVIHIKIYSAYKTFFDGPANSISATNDTGPFDILPKHHNFMTLVNAGDVIVRQEGENDLKLRIARGVMHVRRNKVTLFLDV